MTAETNVYDKIRLDAGKIVNELYFFLDLHRVNFALSSVDPNQFKNISFKEKFKYLIERDIPTLISQDESKSLLFALSRKNNPSWKAARLKIIVPEMRGNTRIVPYFDLEFSLPRLSTEQKLDVIHFAICALNYLSQKDEPVDTFSNSEISSIVLVSKPEHLKVVSDNLNRVRDSVILNAIREKEDYEDDLEFDPNAPDIIRILKAQNQDPKIEKQWLDESSPVFVKAEIEATVERAMKTKGYPPHYLQQIIDTAVRLYEQNDRVRAIDIYQELRIEKNTYNSRIKFFGYDTAMILEAARNKVRESEVTKKVVKSIKR